MDVGACGEVHDGVGTPDGTPLQLLHLFLNAAAHRTVAKIGIDLGQEVAPYIHNKAGKGDVKDDRSIRLTGLIAVVPRRPGRYVHIQGGERLELPELPD